MIKPTIPDRREFIFTTVLFVLALSFHAWGASIGWNNKNLPGCEFRQTQTALSAYFIQADQNFSLAYPTPVLGKPWSIPMEFPLYQWTVVKVAEVSGWDLTQSGRAVTLFCFYLTLPALYLIFCRLGLPTPRALLLLCLVLTCPLYIFYARSFLIETMAWMFGSWFLVGYVNGVERKSVGWIGVAMLGGIGAGLVKVTTFIALLMPAFVWTLWWFVQDWKIHDSKERGRGLLRRVLICAVTVLPSFILTWWWVHYSDAFKSLSPTGSFLQSESMSAYNFGTGVRFASSVWDQHWVVLFRELVFWPILLLVGGLALFVGKRWWRLIILLVFFFFAVQAVFPILYAWHEYYYVPIAMLLTSAIGLVLCGLLESRWPRWLVAAVIVGVLSGQGTLYFLHHYDEQKMFSLGGSDLTKALRTVTEPSDVVIIAGDDWSSMIPYYSQRRALMIRRNLETSWDIILPAYDQLNDEKVAALVLFREQRNNQALLKLTIERFRLDPRPAFVWQEATVYLRKETWELDQQLLADVSGVVPLGGKLKRVSDQKGVEVDMSQWSSRHLKLFSLLTTKPWKFFSTFGISSTNYKGGVYLWSHPVTRLWFHAPKEARKVSLSLKYIEDAYSEEVPPADRTDGVLIEVWRHEANRHPELVRRRKIDPTNNVDDRGDTHLEFDFSGAGDGDLEISILPGERDNYARDWVLLEDVSIE